MPLVIKKQKRNLGFTLIESVTSLLILGLVLFTILSALTSTQKSQNLNLQQIEVFEKADVLLESITAGKTITKYLLTSSEKNQLISRSSNISSKNLSLKVLAENNLKWIQNQRLLTFNQKVKIDGKKYKVQIYRTIIEPVPFLWGIELTVTNHKKKFAFLKAIISYYDYF